MKIARIPSILKEAKELGFLNGESILDIGSGPGRLLPLFLDSAVTNYVAIEPHKPFAEEIEEKLKQLGFNYKVIDSKWEDAKKKLLKQEWDIIILWNSLMFMKPIGKDKMEFAKNTIDEVIDSLKCGGKLLFSLYPAKTGYYDKIELRQIYDYVLSNGKLNILISNPSKMQAVMEKKM